MVDINNPAFNRNSTSAEKYVQRIIKEFPTPSERYYDIRLVKGDDRQSWFGEVSDQCIMFHSNKVCILTLAPTHAVIKENKTIESLEYKFDGYETIDRTDNKPLGKSKKNTQKMHKNSPVCAIKCSDGTKYVITACLNSRLLEVNETIIKNPDLVKKYPLSHGYIAITQPNNWALMNEIRENLSKLQ